MVSFFRVEWLHDGFTDSDNSLEHTEESHINRPFLIQLRQGKPCRNFFSIWKSTSSQPFLAMIAFIIGS